jgi:hypothetical protein
LIIEEEVFIQEFQSSFYGSDIAEWKPLCRDLRKGGVKRKN